jgi:hypothetical protein
LVSETLPRAWRRHRAFALAPAKKSVFIRAEPRARALLS